MESNVLDSISSQYNSLTHSEKKLADYIFSHKTGVQHMSVANLAEVSHVSETTIHRFCKLLGLSYHEFKLALSQAAPSPGLPDSNKPCAISSNGLKNICQGLYQANIDALAETLARFDESSIHQAITLLSKAQKVYCFGQGSSNIMAMEAWARFATVSSSFIHIEDSHMQAMASALCRKGDVILFFFFFGATKDMLDILKPAKSNGASIILVTHFSASPAAMLANVCLLCGPSERPLQSGSITTKIGQLFIIDCLFHGYCQQNSRACAQAQAATSQATARKLL